MNIFKAGLLMITLAIITPVTVAEEQVFYKWTDAEGLTHYTQRAPKGIKAELISTRVSSSEPAKAGNNDSNTASSNDDKPKVTRSDAEQVIQKDAELCQRAQANANTLRTKPIVRQNDKVLTIKQKNAELQKLNEIISIHC